MSFIMNIFALRHGEAEPEDARFGPEGPPLTKFGQYQAVMVGEALKQAGVSLEIMGVSSMCRNQQTAKLLGAKSRIVLPVLEPVRLRQSIAETKLMVEAGEMPEEVIESATAILDNPPEVPSIIHGFEAAALNYLTGNRLGKGRLLPYNIEPFEIEIEIR